MEQQGATAADGRPDEERTARATCSERDERPDAPSWARLWQAATQAVSSLQESDASAVLQQLRSELQEAVAGDAEEEAALAEVIDHESLLCDGVVVPRAQHAAALDASPDALAEAMASRWQASTEALSSWWARLQAGLGAEQESAPSISPPQSRFERQLHQLRSDPATYAEPVKDADAFATWLRTFDLDAHAAECRQVLTRHPNVWQLYQRIVPVLCEPDVFWLRYFYAKHQLERDEAKRRALLQQQHVQEEGEAAGEAAWDEWE
ncbi:hypothetical protein CDCA_CDCA07G2136 [Cyanidium caldarium]|uniref:BSD domain-containing protein n=1 Tax=Cyanidium caldarium TaxID=2771 RepID=A0AAV9IVN0_CYACA|nr:hypothetical protein CDCA_CDCA07G2136 [Cyanidium caldarium]